MFKMGSKKKNKNVAELLDLQKESLEQVDKTFAEIESIKDLTEKIPALQQLINFIDGRKNSGSGKLKNIIDNHADKGAIVIGSAGGLIGAAAFIVPALIVCPPIGMGAGAGMILGGLGSGTISNKHIEKTKRKKLLKQNPEINDFQSAMTALATRAQEMTIAALADLQKEYLERVDKKLIEIEQTNDPAKKILMLQSLINDNSRERQLLNSYFVHGWNRYFVRGSFAELMAPKRAQAERRLDEIIRTCSLEAVALSPSYAEVFDNFPPLRERFKEAAIETARRTHKGPAAPQQEPSAAGQMPLKLLKSNRPGV